MWQISLGALGASLTRRLHLHRARQPSLFEQLPVDIVLYLEREHLPPLSALALALTCKSLYNLLFSTARPQFSRSEHQALGLLLEKDAGHAWWYCDICCVLHPVKPRLTPRSWDLLWGVLQLYRDCRASYVHFIGSGIAVAYYHVHLVMNRHFLGPPTACR
jgi:hypothetical protein